MTEKIELKVGNPPKNKAENGPIWATPENLPFFIGEIYKLFSYSWGLIIYIDGYRSSISLSEL